MDRPDDSLRLKVVQSLEQRAESAKTSDQKTRAAMLSALPVICQIVQGSTDIALKHSAIACVDHVSERFGKKDTSAVLSAAQIIASEAALGNSDDTLRVISLLCLASMVDILRDDMVPILPPILNKCREYLAMVAAESSNSRLHDAIYAFYGAVLEHLPWMFSSKVLQDMLRLTYQAAANIDLGDASSQNREQFTALVARKVEMKTTISCLESTLDAAIHVGPEGCFEMFAILQRVVTVQSKATVLRNSSTLFSLFNRTFDIRRLLVAADERSEVDELNALDLKRNAIVLEAVMKLNDSTFRPFFARLVEWTREGLPRKDEDGRLQRSLSFYSFLARFFDSLKSIVTSYSSYVLEDMTAVLKATTPTSDDQQALLKTVLEALKSSFKHDQDDFWQAPSHFSVICEALLAQLTHAKDPVKRDALGIIPTITELAVAAASPDHHKDLNAALLKNMRSDDVQIRLAAVKCEQNLTESLGEDWLALLPEMLPFISELQEDDDEVVERETLKWIAMIEGILGESLDGMLQ